MDDRTYRVMGIPKEWNERQLQCCLYHHKKAMPTIESLYFNVNKTSQTATVTFQDLFLSNNSGNPVVLEKSSGGPQGPKEYITLDKHFYGLTPLFTPAEENHQVDLIAIHGLGGHAIGSFKEKGGGHVWLRDVLPWRLTSDITKEPIARVITYGYDTDIVGSKAIQSIEDLSTGLHQSLLSLSNTPAAKPIILLAHSLGGLMVKQMLVGLSKSKNEENQRLLKSIYGMTFFGVPHLGMDIESLVAMVGDAPNRFLLDSLGNSSSRVLITLHEDFVSTLGEERKPEIFSFYETLVSPTAKKENGKWVMTGPDRLLVTKQSATNCRKWETGLDYICAINSTHSGMVKFDPGDCKDYEIVVGVLRGLILRATSAQSHIKSDNIIWGPCNEIENLVDQHQVLQRTKRKFGLLRYSGKSKSLSKISIHDLGGTEKTQGILELESSIQETLSDIAVFWIDASSPNCFRKGYERIAKAYNIPGYDNPGIDIIPCVKTRLESLPTRWLMIVNNADDMKPFFSQSSGGTGHTNDEGLGRYLPQSPHGYILIITRDRKAVRGRLTPWNPRVSVGMTERSESPGFPRKTLTEGLPADKSSGLASKPEYLPPSLFQDTTCIPANSMPSQACFDSFEPGGRDSDTSHAIIAAILLVQSARRESQRYSEPLSATRPSNLVECHLATEGAKMIEKSFSTLKAYSIRKGNRSKSPMDPRVMNLAIALAAPKGDEETFRLCQQLSSHPVKVLEHHSLDSTLAAVVCGQVGDYLEFVGQWAHAEGMYDRAVELCSRARCPNDSVTANYITARSKIRLLISKLQYAERLQSSVVEANQDILKDDDPIKIKGYRLLSDIYRNLERFEKAKSAQTKVIRLSTKRYGPSGDSTLEATRKLARICCDQGRFDEAEKSFVDVLKKEMVKQPPDILRTSSIKVELALVYTHQCRFAEADSLCVEAWQANESLLGSEDPDTLALTSHMGTLLCIRHHLEDLEVILKDLVGKQVSILGADHPDNISTLIILALTIKKMARHEEALRIMKVCVRKGQEILGICDEHVMIARDSVTKWQQE